MQLVYEKEKRLRMMMKMHGLGDAAYWLVMYGWFLLLYVAYIAVLLVFGSAVGISLFRQNDCGELGSMTTWWTISNLACSSRILADSL